MKYPEECPVFEVIQYGFPGAGPRNGELAEGVGFLPCGLELRNLSNRLGAVPYFSDAYGTENDDGVEGWALTPISLRPLTRAAREMLALVRP